MLAAAAMALVTASTITTATELTLNITCDIQFESSVQNGVETYREEIEQHISDYLHEVCETWGNLLKSFTISYQVMVYIARIIYAVLQIPEIVNMTNVMINGSGNDLVLTETAELQQVPVLGTVVINGE